MGIGIGLISFIPFVGSIIGFVVSVGIALAQFDNWLPIGAVVGLFACGQPLEGYVLTPKLVGDRVGLHPVWVIFALLAGGTLFGFVGVLLAVPAAAVIGVLIRFAAARYRASRYYRGDPDGATAPRSRPPRLLWGRRFPRRRRNEAAVAWLDRWPDWPGPGLAVHGPAGSGKTHIAHVFQAGANARPARPGDLEQASRGADRGLSRLRPR